MQPTNNLGSLLQRVAFSMARQNDQVLQEKLGIGFSQFKIIMVLQHAPNIQQRAIAELLGQTEASISRQIKLLTDQGLLSMHLRPENRREHLIKLTPKGQKTIEKAITILNNHHAPTFARLTEKQQNRLLESLNTLAS